MNINPLAFNLQAARSTSAAATNAYFAAGGIRFGSWIRVLAVEARNNVNSLRLVSSHRLNSPSLVRWVLTIAFFLVVSPRHGLYLLRLAKSYAALGFFRVGASTRYASAFAIGVTLGLLRAIG